MSITIISMILYFKHIIHIDDFPLNGHPSSIYYKNGDQGSQPPSCTNYWRKHWSAELQGAAVTLLYTNWALP